MGQQEKNGERKKEQVGDKVVGSRQASGVVTARIS
jgi:hypothetical protein